MFKSNPERGVYKTTDGGKTWDLVLHISEQTGAVDLALDPNNARVLFTAVWRFERKPWTLIDGGEESGLYRSTDGGETWQRLGEGLPEGDLGRIGVATSRTQPGRVFALITAAEGRGGVFRSDNSGDTWTRTSDDPDLLTRGWYYSHIEVDPRDADTLWVMNVGFHRSIDAGKTWQRIRTPHGDNHALWINPNHPEIMVEGNDGGATVSLDGGASWSSILNQPTAEFYRVSVDHQFPYRLYGAQQDNSTISVPSRMRGDITPKQYWYSVAGAESGHIAVHPHNPDLLFSGNYLGRIDRLDRKTGATQNMILYPQMQDGTAPKDLVYRFQWNAPILISEHDQSLYHASNYVHRSRDLGETWDTISLDLTRDDAEKQLLPGGPVQFDHTGVEVYSTVFALAESPHDPKVLWAGTDDGRLHTTNDHGATWTEVTPPFLPADSTINSIDVSEHDENQVFVAAYRYRHGDDRPYILKTVDRGKSWELMSDETSGIPQDHFVRVVREDPVRPGLVFAGSEFGLYVSFDGGQRWQTLQRNLPHTPITDLVVHQGDLVVATQGRSFYVLDDLSLLRQVEASHQKEEVFLYQPRPAVLTRFSGFRASDAPPPFEDGLHLFAWISPELLEDDSSTTDPSSQTMRLSIELPEQGDEAERTLRVFELTPEGSTSPDAKNGDSRTPEGLKIENQELKAGMNHFRWDLRDQDLKIQPGSIMSLSTTRGARVPPGRYLARLRLGDGDAARHWVQPLTVQADPNQEAISTQDLAQRHHLAREVGKTLERVHEVIGNLRSLRSQLEDLKRNRWDTQEHPLELAQADKDALTGLHTKIVNTCDEIEDALIQTKSRVNQDAINFPPRLDNQLAYLYTHIDGGSGRPTAASYQRFGDLKAEVAPFLEQWDSLEANELPRFNELAERLDLLRIQAQQ